MSYAEIAPVAIQAQMSARAAFIRNTYAHLAGAILAFVGLEYLLFESGVADSFLGMLANSPGMFLGVLVAFMVASWVANWWARSDMSRGLQYLGLALYIAVEAFIFVPLLSIVSLQPDAGSVIGQAAIMTLAVVGGLTATVFITRKDYSFLGPIISIACFASLGLILAGYFFHFNLGLLYSFFMVALASASILYTTSNMMYYYRTDQYVAASLSLFASVALLFYYILRIFLNSRQ